GEMILLTDVPHEHHTERLEEEHVCEQNHFSSLLDLFRLAFHSDIGEGHLDHFIAADNDTFQKESVGSIDFIVGDIYINATEPNIRIYKQEEGFNYCLLYIPTHLYPFDFRRGPPSYL
ncbi:MAG: hypothetical protein HKN76_09680, partial [Saprospiraceae bacterium]|nr:hypothetical protein [Saprospiraceae bacterium]